MLTKQLDNQNNMSQDGKCFNEYTRIDQIVATVILVLFFLIGTLSNLSFITIYLHKQRPSSTTSKRRSVVVLRIKNQVSNKAIFTLSISNLLLSVLFIPYTIVFRVWNVDAPWFILLVLEHFKDNLLYMNLLIIVILSIERYVAVCKPQHYKSLESNINKIIWIIFLIGFVLSGTNYFIDVKQDLVCTANIFIHRDEIDESTTRTPMNNDGSQQLFGSQQQQLYSIEGNNNNNSPGSLMLQSNQSASSSSPSTKVLHAKNKNTINLNLLTSGVIFLLSACISTFFYVQIAWQHLIKARQLKHKCQSVGNEIKRVSSMGVCTSIGGSEKVKMSEKNETTTRSIDSQRSQSSFRETRCNNNRASQSSMRLTTAATTTTLTSTAAVAAAEAAGEMALLSGGGGRSGGDKPNFSRQFSNNSDTGIDGAGETTTNQAENDDSDLSKSKSDASVQTDFVAMHKSKKIVKKKYSNIFATNLITKISIWLSVIIWVSILPFMLSVLELVPYYRFIYFLYYIENVFSPLVYICLNKRYRNYLKKLFKLKINKK